MLTWEEFRNIRIYELDNRTYKKVWGVFARLLGEDKAERLMTMHLETRLEDVANCNIVNVFEAFTLI